MSADLRKPAGPPEDNADAAIREAFGADLSPEANGRLQSLFDGFRSDLALHAYVQQLGRRGGERPRRPLRRLAFAMTVAAAAVILGLALLPGHGTPVWADVVERFRSVEFFSATIYVKDDALAQPEQFELWVAKGGRLRMRVGSQVMFRRQGEPPRAFDVRLRKETEPDHRALRLLEIFGDGTSFSLDTVIRMIPGGGLVDMTPVVNAEAAVSSDMLVFDIQAPSAPEWVRIWALRESRLPVRVLMWDPRDGECGEALFSYDRQQPDAFFDPEAFAEELTSSDRGRGDANLAYALIQDPGGQAVTPQDLFERKSSYRVPTVDDAGITEDGLVWVVTTDSENRMPSGYVFSGFQRLEDDLGRRYQRVGGVGFPDGRSLGILMPADYPFDERMPQRLTFVCETPARGDQKPEVVGTVDLTEWKRGKRWPASYLREELYPLVRAASHSLRARDDDRFERIMAMIPGDPSTDPRALAREQLRLSMLVKKQDYAGAAALGTQLMPLLEKEYVRWKGSQTRPDLFGDYLVALVASDRIQTAQDAYRRILALEPEIPDRLNARARSKIKQWNKKAVDDFARQLSRSLSWEARMTVEQIGDFFGVDLKTDERFKDFNGWDWDPSYRKPENAAWIRHTEELAKHYQSNPLTERMELRPNQMEGKFYACTRRIPRIETHEITLLRRSLHSFVRARDGSYFNIVEAPDELEQVELNHDLVYRKDSSLAERQEFVLREFGYRIDEVTERRKVWVAQYDGRALKPYRNVEAPVPYPGSGPRETGMAVVMGRLSMAALLANLMRTQTELPYRLWIVDETGLRATPPRGADWASVAVSSESPTWAGEGGLEMARKWFADEFGVTFAEETRPVTVHVISKVEPAP